MSIRTFIIPDLQICYGEINFKIIVIKILEVCVEWARGADKLESNSWLKRRPAINRPMSSSRSLVIPSKRASKIEKEKERENKMSSAYLRVIQ